MIHSGMTVKDLIEELQEIPEDTPVVQTGPDHSYYEVGSIAIVSAEVTDDPYRPYLEYYNRDNMSDPDAPVITVCHIG